MALLRALARAFVSDDSSADRSTKPPMLVLLESLAFYRNARVGLVVGALFAVLPATASGRWSYSVR